MEKILRERRLFVELRESIETQRRKVEKLKEEAAEHEGAVKRQKRNISFEARRRRAEQLKAKSAEVEEAVERWVWLCNAYWFIWNVKRKQLLEHYSVQVALKADTSYTLHCCRSCSDWRGYIRFMLGTAQVLT